MECMMAALLERMSRWMEKLARSRGGRNGRIDMHDNSAQVMATPDGE
jgi:hypothetical protein